HSRGQKERIDRIEMFPKLANVERLVRLRNTDCLPKKRVQDLDIYLGSSINKSTQPISKDGAVRLPLGLLSPFSFDQKPTNLGRREKSRIPHSRAAKMSTLFQLPDGRGFHRHGLGHLTAG